MPAQTGSPGASLQLSSQKKARNPLLQVMKMKVAFHTLGCKVNQYDSQAMLELFERAGYEAGDLTSPATCT